MEFIFYFIYAQVISRTVRQMRNASSAPFLARAAAAVQQIAQGAQAVQDLTPRAYLTATARAQQATMTRTQTLQNASSAPSRAKIAATRLIALAVLLL